MNKILIIFLTIMCSSLSLLAQNSVYITVGGRSETITLVNNDATRNLVETLANGPLTISMDDYGGFEKVGPLPMALPISDSRITTGPGDVILSREKSSHLLWLKHVELYATW